MPTPQQSVKQVPMLAPDGTQGMVDTASAQEAVSKGYRPAIHMYSPEGVKGLVALTDMGEALKANYKREGDYNQPAPPPSEPAGGIINSGMRFLSGAAGAGADAAKGIYHSVADPAPTGVSGILQSLMPGGVVGYRTLVKPQVDQAKQAVTDAKAGNYSQMVGHGVASVLPGIGPAVASTVDAATPKIADGDYAGAAGGVATNALLAYLGGKVGKGIAGEAKVPGQNYTPSHAAAFEGMTAKATGMGKNFIPQNLTPEALSEIRQTAADMQAGSPTDQGVAKAVTSRSTPPLDRLSAVQNVIQKSLSNLEDQHAPALAQAASTPVDMRPIQSSLKAQIVPGMSDADVAGIQDLIDRSGQITNIGELNQFRQLMNQEASPSYRQSPTQAGRASAPQSVATDAANAVRSHYFDQLQQATGRDFQPLKAKESNILTVKEALENMSSPEAKAEATFHAGAKSLKEHAGDLANIIKDPRATVTQTILRESPGTRLSNLIRKSLSDLPEATPPAPVAPPQAALNGGAAQGRIAAPPPEVLQGAPVTPQAPPPIPSQAALASVSPQMLNAGISPRLLTEISSASEPVAPSAPYPPLNEATARTRVTPTQFRQTQVAPSVTRPVTPSGKVMTPLQRFLEAGELDGTITNPSVDDIKRAISKMRSRRDK